MRAGQDFIDALELRQLAWLPPGEAFQQAQLLDGKIRQQAMSAAARRWAEQDLAGFLHVLSELPQSNHTRNMIMNSFYGPLRENPTATMRQITSYLKLDQFTVGRLLSNVVRNMSFGEASDFIKAYASETDDPTVLSTVASELFEADPAQAMELFEDFSLSERQQIYGNLAFKYVALSRDDALSWALSLDNGFSRAKQNVFKQVVKQDPSYLEQLWLTMDDPMNKRLMFIELGTAKAMIDPRGTLEWVTDYESEPGYRQISSIAFRQWIYKDPWAVGDYISDKLIEDKPLPLMNQLIQQMMRADSRRAERYVDGLPSSLAKQQAISGIALEVANSDPKEAYSILEDLQNKEMRENVVWKIATSWASREPNRIDEITDLMKLSPEQTARLRTAYTDGRR